MHEPVISERQIIKNVIKVRMKSLQFRMCTRIRIKALHSELRENPMRLRTSAIVLLLVIPAML
jgi:hypothetical protein